MRTNRNYREDRNETKGTDVLLFKCNEKEKDQTRVK